PVETLSGEGEIRTLDGPVTHNGFRARPLGRLSVLNSETAVGPFPITVCAVSATVSFARERIKRVSESDMTVEVRNATCTRRPSRSLDRNRPAALPKLRHS